MGYKTEVLTVFKEASAGSRELRINFGVFAGRSATPAELDDLARTLLPELGDVTIIAEDRRELNESSETSLHQVRIDLPQTARRRARGRSRRGMGAGPHPGSARGRRRRPHPLARDQEQDPA